MKKCLLGNNKVILWQRHAEMHKSALRLIDSKRRQIKDALTAIIPLKAIDDLTLIIIFLRKNKKKYGKKFNFSFRDSNLV